MARILVKSLLWAICCTGIATLLDLTLTWRVLVLVVVMGSISNVIEWADGEMLE